MIFLYIFGGIVFAFAAYLFFAPLYIEIDTEHSLYRIRLHRLFSVAFLVDNTASLVEMQLLSRKWRMDLSKAPARKETEPVRTGTTAHGARKSAVKNIPARKLAAVLKSFRINQLEVTIDTGDMQWNGMLYPLFYWLGASTGKNIQINFEGRNSILLQLENNLARMSKAFLSA